MSYSKSDLPKHTCPTIDEALKRVNSSIDLLCSIEDLLEEVRLANDQLRTMCCNLIEENQELREELNKYENI